MSAQHDASRRTILGGLAASGVASALPARSGQAPTLAWRHFPMDESGFYHTPVLVTGPTEAVLLDGVFTWSQGRLLVDAVKASGKRLTTVYISCNDPDFYFGLGPVHDAFPEAKFIAAPATAAAIQENVDEKLHIWAEKLGGNGPKTRADLTLPVASDDQTLSIDGQPIEIVTAPDMFDRRYYWVPSLRAVFGSDLIIAGLHVWMADTPRHETIRAWITALDAIEARRPAIAVAGHMTVNSPTDLATVRFTRDYLRAFEEERARATNSHTLIAAMQRRYPDLLGAMYLELGAKVVMGEMRWGRQG